MQTNLKRRIDTQEKLKWQCVNGHVWEANIHHIGNHGHWCPYCVGLTELKKFFNNTS